LNLQNRVFLLGKKTNPYKYLQRSDCFVFGSNHEGFPNVVLEALATNLPVISTNCPSGPQEILAPTNKNEYGILTPVNNSNEMYRAMQLLLTDNNKANYYKNQARIRAKDFDKTELLQHYLKVINE
jgi:N-acetylgalactosamine-N,N'-diacetylbacillosaminyl-diphospho-undecaprenol 4-alpha-N-acetylgalactosaminyltransferase